MPERPAASAWPTLLMLTALSALAFMDRQIVAVLLVPIKSEFGLSDLQAGLVTTIGFAASFGLLALPLAHLADRARDRRRLVAWCRGAGGALAALGALAGNGWTLMLTRGGSALSEAGGAPASMSMIADLFAPARRTRAMGVFTMGASVGSLIALIGGAWLAQRHGWRATLAVVGVTALAAALALRAFAGEPRRTIPLHADAARTRPRGATRAIWADPVARRLIVAAACALLAGYSFAVWNFAYLVRGLGLSLQQAGAVAGLSALGSVLAAPLSGALVDLGVRHDQRWQMGVPVVGLTLALPIGLVYLALGPGQVALSIVLVVAFAFFISFWVAPTYAALSLVVPPERRALASSLVMLVGAVGGGGIGPLATGALSDGLAAHVEGDPLRPALACMLLLLLPAIAALWRAMAPYRAARLASAARVQPA